MIPKNKIEKKNIWLLPTLLCVWSFWFSVGQVWAAEPIPAPVDSAKPAEETQPVNFSYVDLNKALSFQFEGRDFAAFLDQKFDIQSFMNKPVRLPIGSDNPDGVPGGDQDFLYIYPPEFFFSEKTGTVSTIPSKIMYFGSGQKINDNRAKYFRKDLQKKVIQLLQEKSVAVESLRAVIVKQAAKRYRQVGLITDYSQKIGLAQSSNQLSLLERIFSLNEAKAEDTNATELTNLVSDLKNQISDQTSGATTFSQDDAIEKIIGSGDSQTREMLSLLLLLLIYKNALAEPQTDLKAQCVAAGGEWLNEACSVDTITGGASGATNNVTALGSKKICEESGGTWKTEYPMRKVCMAQCGAKDDACTDKILAGEIANKGCVCPDGSCVTAVGDCLAQDASKTDKDEDEIPDGVDKCPKSKDVESGVSMNDQGDTYGCTCADLQAKGRIQQRQCPGAACDGAYMVTYAQTSGTDSCEMGNIIPFSCVANRTADQNCQKAAESDKKDDKKKEDNMDWMKMLQQLMQGGGQSGGQGGGGSGGGGGGGGGGGCNNGSCGNPTGPSEPTKPNETGATATPKPQEQSPTGKPPTAPAGQPATPARSAGIKPVKTPDTMRNTKEALDNVENEFKQNETAHRWEEQAREYVRQAEQLEQTYGRETSQSRALRAEAENANKISQQMNPYAPNIETQLKGPVSSSPSESAIKDAIKDTGMSSEEFNEWYDTRYGGGDAVAKQWEDATNSVYNPSSNPPSSNTSDPSRPDLFQSPPSTPLNGLQNAQQFTAQQNLSEAQKKFDEAIKFKEVNDQSPIPAINRDLAERNLAEARSNLENAQADADSLKGSEGFDMDQSKVNSTTASLQDSVVGGGERLFEPQLASYETGGPVTDPGPGYWEQAVDNQMWASANNTAEQWGDATKEALGQIPQTSPAGTQIGDGPWGSSSQSGGPSLNYEGIMGDLDPASLFEATIEAIGGKKVPPKDQDRGADTKDGQDEEKKPDDSDGTGVHPSTK